MTVNFSARKNQSSLRCLPNRIAPVCGAASIHASLRLLMVALAGALSAPAVAEAETIINRNDPIGATGYSWLSGNLRIANGATVASSVRGASGIVSYNNGFVTLTNDGGTIRGNVAGINSLFVSNVSLINNIGEIQGDAYGIANLGVIGKIANSGDIIGRRAIYNNGGRIDIIENDGSIAGFGSNGSAVRVMAGSIGSLVNNGLIRGSFKAISVGIHGSMQSLHNWGTIAGDISYEAARELLISGGAGNLPGTLTGAAGGIGNADIGLLEVPSNIRFLSGSQLLNDHVNVGNHSVINDATHLRINNRITISGNYQQERAARLLVSVGDDARGDAIDGYRNNGYGQLVVAGNATIAAGSAVALVANRSYPFAAGQRFVVMRAGSASYHADLLQYSASGFDGVVTGSSITDGGQQILLLSLRQADAGCQCEQRQQPGSDDDQEYAGIDWINAADNRHAIDALDAVSRYEGINDDMLAVYNPIMTLVKRHQANRGGSQLTPVAVTSASGQAARATLAGVFKATAERIEQTRSDRTSGIASGERTALPALWVKAFGGRIRQHEHDEAAGYHGNFRGMMLGTDVLINERWRIGGLSSYATTTVANDGHNLGSSVNLNAYGLTAYSGYDGKFWYLDVIAGAAYQQFSTLRAISFSGFADSPTGHFSGMQYQASVQAGFPLLLNAATRLVPLTGLSYSMLRQNGYTEHGNAAALAVRAAASSSLKSDLGVRLERLSATTFGDLTTSLQLGWRRELHASRLRSDIAFVADESGASSFVTSGVAPISSTVVAALGATLAHSRNLAIAASFAVEAGHGFVGQTADIRLRWQY